MSCGVPHSRTIQDHSGCREKEVGDGRIGHLLALSTDPAVVPLIRPTDEVLRIFIAAFMLYSIAFCVPTV